MASMVIRRFIKVGGLLRKAKKHGVMERSSGISYGFYCVENPDGSEDSVVAQKVETDCISMRLFGVFDHQMEGLTATHLQSHFLLSTTNYHNESKIRRSTKAAIRNAYKKSMEKSRNCQGGENNGGFATLLLSSNRKIVVASSGGFEIVLCKGGTATPVGALNSVSDLIPMPCIAQKSAAKEPKERLVITTRNLEPGTRFIIMASNGVWEVLGYQEAVHLLNHIEDAQKAAECLAEEAISRLSKSNISCLIIRF